MTTALEQAAQDWIAHLTVLGRSPRTIELRQDRLAAVITFLHHRGCLRPADVSATDIDAYMLERQSQGIARESLHSFRTTIRGFFDWYMSTERSCAILRTTSIWEHGMNNRCSSLHFRNQT